MATETTVLPRLLNARQVANQTGEPLWRIYELTRSGDLPHVRLGRAVRYPADRLLAWLDNGGTGDWAPPVGP